MPINSPMLPILHLKVPIHPGIMPIPLTKLPIPSRSGLAHP
ncbi:hypothetical protein [Sporosarcina aquimarina]|nr:hypothetical protein [Sporosarcina aquimarina]